MRKTVQLKSRSDSPQPGVYGGRPIRTRRIRAEEPPRDIAPAASLRAAALRGITPGLEEKSSSTAGQSSHPGETSHSRQSARGVPRIERDDLQVRVRRQTISALVLFVLDVSDSMGAHRRIREAKGSVYGLLKKAHSMRYRVGLITVQGREAVLTVPPTPSIGVAKKNMSGLKPAGGTPLASGLRLALRTIHNEELKHPGIEPILVVISDGEATVPLKRRGDPFIELLELAEKIRRRERVTTICVDTKEQPPYSTGLTEMMRLSRTLGARYCRRSSRTKQE
ncbi:MAG: VWA domain-containing protein [Spirochaetia bacterium]